MQPALSASNVSTCVTWLGPQMATLPVKDEGEGSRCGWETLGHKHSSDTCYVRAGGREVGSAALRASPGPQGASKQGLASQNPKHHRKACSLPGGAPQRAWPWCKCYSYREGAAFGCCQSTAPFNKGLLQGDLSTTQINPMLWM